MKLVKFLRDYGGYTRGSYQWYEETIAKALVDVGIGEIYVENKEPQVEPEVTPMVEPEKEKQVDKPKKDKMVRSPRQKK